MNRIVHITPIVGEKAAGIVNMGIDKVEPDRIFLQITKEAAPVESAFITVNVFEAQEIIDALIEFSLKLPAQEDEYRP